MHIGPTACTDRGLKALSLTVTLMCSILLGRAPFGRQGNALPPCHHVSGHQVLLSAVLPPPTKVLYSVLLMMLASDPVQHSNS